MQSADTLSPPRWRPLTGGTAVWVFMTVELVTFGMFLLGHAWGWRSEPDAYRQGQALLHPASGLRGTVLLLLGSGLAYQGVLAFEESRRRASAAWLLAAAAAGLAFAVNKVLEYADPALADVTLSTSTFWFGYLFLTGLHLLHVLGGVAVLPWLAWRAWQGQAEALTVQAGAAYWHLVDVIWVLLFPILYLMQP
ncbi:cytochrome c oxidase subunit 3 [Myxococcota bacterium]|nr:cytochrome c oxidase subunit 3 [Myxococcota bacterium]